MGNAESLNKDVQIGESLCGSCPILSKIWTSISPGIYKGQRKVTIFVKEFTVSDSDDTKAFFENGVNVCFIWY